MSIQSPQTSYGMHDFVEGLNGAIRQNPLAAGLIGAGLAWIFLRNTAVLNVGARVPGAVVGAAKAVTSAAGRGVQAISGVVASAGAGTADTVRSVAGKAGDAATAATASASDSLGKLGNSADGVLQSVAETANETMRASMSWAEKQGTSLRDRLTHDLEAQPLLLGAIGAVIGAGLASVFPTTTSEQRIMGAAGAGTRDKLQELATRTRDVVQEKAGHIFDEVKSAAADQGLTGDGLKAAAGEIKETIEGTVGVARKAVESRIAPAAGS